MSIDIFKEQAMNIAQSKHIVYLYEQLKKADDVLEDWKFMKNELDEKVDKLKAECLQQYKDNSLRKNEFRAEIAELKETIKKKDQSISDLVRKR